MENRIVELPKTAFSKPPEGSWTPGGSHVAAKAARKLTLGGSGGARGALLGASWGSFWDLPGADLDVLDDVCGAT